MEEDFAGTYGFLRGIWCFVGEGSCFCKRDGLPFMKYEGCKGFEEMMECEGFGRWRIKNELECEGLRGGGGGRRKENQAGLRIFATLLKILLN